MEAARVSEEAELQSRVNAVDAEIGRLYRARAPLLERLAELRGEYEMPAKARHRTETQQRVKNCPRCGAKPESEG